MKDARAGVQSALDIIEEELSPLSDFEQILWEGFHELCSERPVASGDSGVIYPLPFLKIVAWAKFYEFTKLETDVSVKAIRIIDAAFINAMHERKEAKRPPQPK